MKQCMRIRTQYLGSTLLSRRCQRFASDDASKGLVLLEKIEKGLGDDGRRIPLRIEPASKTISTPYGSLPISPLMDPAWIEARGRFRTGKPGAKKPVGRFRRLLSRNPYGTLHSWSSRNFAYTKQHMLLRHRSDTAWPQMLDSRGTSSKTSPS